MKKIHGSQILGNRMRFWGEPGGLVYRVGASFYAGKPVSPDMLEGAIAALNKMQPPNSEGKTKKKELLEALRRLSTSPSGGACCDDCKDGKECCDDEKPSGAAKQLSKLPEKSGRAHYYPIRMKDGFVWIISADSPVDEGRVFSLGQSYVAKGDKSSFSTEEAARASAKKRGSQRGVVVVPVSFFEQEKASGKLFKHKEEPAARRYYPLITAGGDVIIAGANARANEKEVFTLGTSYAAKGGRASFDTAQAAKSSLYKRLMADRKPAPKREDAQKAIDRDKETRKRAIGAFVVHVDPVGREHDPSKGLRASGALSRGSKIVGGLLLGFGTAAVTTAGVLHWRETHPPQARA